MMVANALRRWLGAFMNWLNAARPDDEQAAP
jgi:hypothetical protein